MTDIITKIARMKPWLLFVATIVPMCLALLLFFPSVDPHSDMASFQLTFTMMMLISLIGALIFYAWILVVGVICNQSLDPRFRKSERLFRFSVPFAMAYITIGVFVFPEAVLISERTILRAIILPLHFAASLLLFYSVFFSARSIAMTEQPTSPGFWRSLKYFFLLLYYPIGLWFVQPRINSIQASQQAER